MVENENKQLKSRRDLLVEKQGDCVWDPVRRGKHSNTSYCTALGGKSGEWKAGPCTVPESKKQTKFSENSCSEDTKVIRK